MSEHVEGLNRDQTLLFPETLQQYITNDNPVRFIDRFVDSLNLQALAFSHTEPTELGRPSYDPKDLLKLYIYGYLNQIRTSRRLEQECHRNIEVIWLMKKLTPDHKTIADFRKDNPAGIKTVFKELVQFCKHLGLYGHELIALDGTKLKAVNAPEKAFTQKGLANRIKRTEDEAQRYLEELDAADAQEANQSKPYWESKVKNLLSNKEKYEALLEEMRLTGQSEVALTDPECRFMKNHKRIEPCYNAHIAVDAKNHLIVDYNVTNLPNDNHELNSLAVSAKETLEAQKIDVTADSGFFDTVEIKKCVDNGITPYVAQCKSNPNVVRGNVLTPQFKVENFVYNKDEDVYVCPAGEKLEFWFSTKDRGKTARIYRCKSGACCSCKYYRTKCTKNRLGRTIWRLEHQGVVDDMSQRFRGHPEMMDKRKAMVEHPFGTIKRAFGAGYLLLKGLRKVAGEVGLVMLAYNLRRVLNILGPRALIQARV